MKCNHPIWSPVCAFHYNGICTRDHNYECPALAMKNLSNGEMVQLAEERKDLVKVVRCKDCVHGFADTILGIPYYHCAFCGAHDGYFYCAAGEPKEKTDG